MLDLERPFRGVERDDHQELDMHAVGHYERRYDLLDWVGDKHIAHRGAGPEGSLGGNGVVMVNTIAGEHGIEAKGREGAGDVVGCGPEANVELHPVGRMVIRRGVGARTDRGIYVYPLRVVRGIPFVDLNRVASFVEL